MISQRTLRPSVIPAVTGCNLLQTIQVGEASWRGPNVPLISYENREQPRTMNVNLSLLEFALSLAFSGQYSVTDFYMSLCHRNIGGRARDFSARRSRHDPEPAPSRVLLINWGVGGWGGEEERGEKIQGLRRHFRGSFDFSGFVLFSPNAICPLLRRHDERLR